MPCDNNEWLLSQAGQQKIFANNSNPKPIMYVIINSQELESVDTIEVKT